MRPVENLGNIWKLMSNNNRIKLKANRNLYQDQITFISILAKQMKVSDSEILRRIIDAYIEAQGKNS